MTLLASPSSVDMTAILVTVISVLGAAFLFMLIRYINRKDKKEDKTDNKIDGLTSVVGEAVTEMKVTNEKMEGIAEVMKEHTAYARKAADQALITSESALKVSKNNQKDINDLDTRVLHAEMDISNGGFSKHSSPRKVG